MSNSDISLPPAQGNPPRIVPDGLEAANRAYEDARRGVNGASWNTARGLYDAFLKNPGTAATAQDRAEATFFMARCLQEERLIPGARHAFSQLLENRDFANSPLRAEAAFRLAEISHQAGGHQTAIEEFTRCKQILEALPQGSPRPDFARWIIPLLADSHLREGHYREARELFSETLRGTPPAEIATFAREGLARQVILAGRAARQATGEEQTRLFVEARSTLQLLQRDFPNDPLTASTLRGLAGIAYDQANSGNTRASWERARELFSQVHALGDRSPHRLDSLFFLGWSEYRLGNFSEAHGHFSAFTSAAGADTRRAEAQALAGISLAESKLKAAAEASGPNATQTQRTNYLEALRALSTIDNPERADFVRALTLRTARLTIPLLDPVGNPQQYTSTIESLRAIMGDRYEPSGLDVVLYNRGRALLYPSGPAQAGDRDRGMAFLRTVAADFPDQQSGSLAGIEVARAEGNSQNLLNASQSLVRQLGAISETNRTTWMYAQTQQIAAQVGLGNVQDARRTFEAAETALREAPQTVRDQFRGAAMTQIVDSADRLRGLPTPTAEQLTAAAEAYQYIIGNDATRGSILRARSHLGCAATFEAQGNRADALARYRQIGLLYPATQEGRPAFTGVAFDRVRQQAAEGVRRLGD